MTHTPPPLHVGPATALPPTGPIRPSGWWYLLVPVLLLAGVAAGVATALDEGRAVFNSFSTLGADGAGSVELESGDEATVFALWSDGRATSTLERPEAAVAIIDPAGETVRFDPAGPSRSTYAHDGVSAIDLGSFEAHSDGSFDVQVTFADGALTGSAAPNAAVGRLDWASIVGRVLRPVALGAAASFGLLLALLVLRRSSKRRLRRAAVAPASQGPISFG